MHPYAVGLLAQAPDDVAVAMAGVFHHAERLAQRNCAEDTPAERAIHAVWITYVAQRCADDDLRDWLNRAAALIVADWGFDAEADLDESGAANWMPTVERTDGT